ncbi:class I SAM-dependent methyltransferase [Shewanella sp. C32]|uniref:Class I SAM-dependent methyltransferase n=1 Tax=Shewanella electrica TaxID=515560 RepID=A0ABT2FPJ1_9GAMM|nr:class I SAM-dependent methyltransferase [Shewanella electrica]MCH1926066.1 class I SAM-dependent methyltransferase [Shewanella electrica]MCS4557565.1 class I SAM-dependent methyltransferase [Shewanella electrica]
MSTAKNLAQQLRCPNGEQAIAVGSGMNQANGLLNQRCIERLQLSDTDAVLEIGPGNGAFAAQICAAANNIHYTGVDWSAEMVTAAEQLNHDLIRNGYAQFLRADAAELPYAKNSFTKLLAVHVIYFWQPLARYLAELQRVLTPRALCCFAFGDRSFMQQLPFTAYDFTLYDAQHVQHLLHQHGFTVEQHWQHEETGLSNTGEMVQKTLHILICRNRKDAL